MLYCLFQNMIQGMLEVDSEKRLTSADVLEHPWVAVRHHKLMTWLIMRRH